MGNACYCIPIFLNYFCSFNYAMSCIGPEMMHRDWADQKLHPQRRDDRSDSSSSGEPASLIFPARVAALLPKKEILPLSLSPEIWKQHCASKAMAVISPSSALLLTFFTSRGNSRGRLLPREDSCRVGGFHYTCSRGNRFHIVLNFIALGCNRHPHTNAFC